MKVVLASHNQKKMVEMKAILSQMGVEVLSQAEVGVDLEPRRDGHHLRGERPHQGPGGDAGHRPARHRR